MTNQTSSGATGSGTSTKPMAVMASRPARATSERWGGRSDARPQTAAIAPKGTIAAGASAWNAAASTSTASVTASGR
jgi:hypothetical protein